MLAVVMATRRIRWLLVLRVPISLFIELEGEGSKSFMSGL